MALSLCTKCNRSFNLESLKVHEKICRGQFLAKSPTKPAAITFGRSLDIYDESINADSESDPQNGFKVNQESKFVTCKSCGKTFTIHSINHHTVACDLRAQRERKEQEAQRKHDAGPTHVGRLPGVVCYICGRNFGTTSIDIHEKQCLDKFRKQNNELPKNERRPEPVKPQTNKEMLEQMVKEQKLKGNTGYNEQAAMNDANAVAYNQNLVACPNCSRTFNPDALKFHIKACTNRKPARKVGDVTAHH